MHLFPAGGNKEEIADQDGSDKDGAAVLRVCGPDARPGHQAQAHGHS